MKKKTVSKKTNLGLIPKMARKFGENSNGIACIWWYHQPKLPKALKVKK